MVATACRTLLESLSRLPNEDGRTKVAIVAFDVALYFFSMPVCLIYVHLIEIVKMKISLPAWYYRV